MMSLQSIDIQINTKNNRIHVCTIANTVLESTLNICPLEMFHLLLFLEIGRFIGP